VPETEAPLALLNISTETPVDEALGRSAACDVIFADILDPLSLMRNGMSTLPFGMPTHSHRDIVGGTLQLLSALAEESTLSADPDYCEELADQLEQLLPVIARLRRGTQSAPKPICATAGPSSRDLNDCRNLPPSSSEFASNRSSSMIRPRAQGCGSGSS
jgi:hypothetical protein